LWLLLPLLKQLCRLLLLLLLLQRLHHTICPKPCSRGCPLQLVSWLLPLRLLHFLLQAGTPQEFCPRTLQHVCIASCCSNHLLHMLRLQLRLLLL
jgi:hypothetical protein